MRNLHHTITINQKAIIDNGWNLPFEMDGLKYKADLNTFALLDFLCYFANLAFKDGNKLKINDDGFIWINYKYIRENNPLLPLSNRNYIKNHLTILEHFGLIILQKDECNNVYFKFGKNFESADERQSNKNTPKIEKVKEVKVEVPKKIKSENKADECLKVANEIYDNAKANNETERGLPRVDKQLWLDFVANKYKLMAKKRKELKSSLIETHFNELRILQEFNIEPNERLQMCIENDYLGLLFDKERERWRKQGKQFQKEVNFAKFSDNSKDDDDIWAGVEVIGVNHT